MAPKGRNGLPPLVPVTSTVAHVPNARQSRQIGQAGQGSSPALPSLPTGSSRRRDSDSEHKVTDRIADSSALPDPYGTSSRGHRRRRKTLDVGRPAPSPPIPAPAPAPARMRAPLEPDKLRSEQDGRGKFPERDDDAHAWLSEQAQPGGHAGRETLVLGSGAIGTVYLRTDKDGQHYAAKRVPLLPGGLQPEAPVGRELRVLRRLEENPHRNLVSPRAAPIESDGYIEIGMEYCPGGDLGQTLQNRGAIPEAQARVWLSQLVEGVAHLHELGVAHRDIKPGNIYLDGHGEIKIGDFGTAYILDGGSLQATARTRSTLVAGTVIGSFRTMAPEVFGPRHSDAPPEYNPYLADMFSVGAVAYEMLYGVPLVQADNILAAALWHFRRESDDLAFPNRPPVSDEMKELLKQILSIDPTKRPSITELRDRARRWT